MRLSTRDFYINARPRKKGGVNLPHKHDEGSILPHNAFMHMLLSQRFMCPSTSRNTLASKAVGLVNEEEKAEEQDCTPNLRKPDPHIRLAFSTSIIVLCEGIVVFYSAKR